MKENEKKVSILTADDKRGKAYGQPNDKKSTIDRLKKPLIFGLMGIVFTGCMYLIFNPSKDKKEIENIGLNESVPEAADQEMQADKQKAYEKEILEEKQQQKRNALTTLSDYWKEDSLLEETQVLSDQKGQGSDSDQNNEKDNPALNSYRNAQNALGSFYQQDNSETQQLKKQLEELKAEVAQKDVPAPVTVDEQLVLMEKSYQMAAKYLPTTGSAKQTHSTHSTADTSAAEKKSVYFAAFNPAEKNTVSSLERQWADSAVLGDFNGIKKRDFYSAGSVQQVQLSRNSVKACVDQTQTVVGESVVRLRLLEAARIGGRIMAKGSIVTADAKIQTGRLQLKVSSIETQGTIIAVDITGYDLDGQKGLFVPYSAERNAVSEIAGNMSQQSGTSLMMTQSASQQMAADLSRGVVQGVSGYFSKKVKAPKVKLKAGHQLFLVCKK